jgi:hypothetical protein
MNKKMNKILLALLIVASLSSCSYETFTSSSEYDAVVTKENPDYKYSANKTYALIDEVKVFSNNVNNSLELKDFDKWSTVILDRIDKNMNDLGYTKITDDPESADVVLTAGVVASENWEYYGYYYWSGWSGYYYYYPSYIYAVDMSYGSVMITMIDPDETSKPDTDILDTDQDSDGNEDLVYEPVWSSGIISLFSSITEKKVNSKIDQAFDQSPYLKVN